MKQRFEKLSPVWYGFMSGALAMMALFELVPARGEIDLPWVIGLAILTFIFAVITCE